MSNGTKRPQVERLMMGQLVCWRVRTQEAELLVAQQGAQVLSYQRLGEPPLIWLSDQAEFKPGQGVRGGVPVCWPWFGDLNCNPPAVQACFRQDRQIVPAHGLVRTLDWQLLGVANEDQEVRLDFAFIPGEDDQPGWPQVSLKLRIRLNQRLHISLTSLNQGEQTLTISQALHSYFAVSDIHQVRLEGLDNSRYLETLEDWQERWQAGDLRFEGETDRLYLGIPTELSVLDQGWQRRIHLHSQGSRSAVVWNPWVDKARRLSQFADDAWQRMLCIETANVMEDVVSLAPGQSHTLAVSIWSEALAD